MAYSFDPLGTNPANRVPNEEHTVTLTNGTNVFYYFLDAAPFFEEGLAIVDPTTGDTLTPGVDYVLGHKYALASSQLRKDVYGSIAFTDPTRQGTYKHTYQALGDPFINTGNAVIVAGLSTLESLQSVLWEDLADVPSELPPGPHNLPTADIEGYTSLLAQFPLLIEALQKQSREFSLDDIADLDPTLVTPLLSALADISATIQAGALFANTAYAYFSTATLMESVVPSPQLGVWTDTDCTITIPVTGTWEAELNVNPKVVWVGTSGIVDMRWVLNGQVVSEAYSKKFVKGFTVGDVIKVQIRVSVEPASEINLKSSVHESTVLFKKLTS